MRTIIYTRRYLYTFFYFR